MMNIDYPLIESFLDDDLYKFTQGAVIFHNFPNAFVTYKFFNRGKTKFPKGFAEELINQINYLSNLSLTDDEANYLKGLPPFRRTFVEWLKHFKLDANEVHIMQHEDGSLDIGIQGFWYRTIFWEVKLMALISELYFLMTGVKMSDDWKERIEIKGQKLSAAGCKWSDFGTRRRFSGFVQENVVEILSKYNGFIGTSNPYFAKKYNVPVIGTSAHEAVMAMSALVGVKMANKTWLNLWSDYYKGQLGIALPDTFTTDVFLKDFDGATARLWDGLRQDSGEPNDWMDNKIIPHYKKLGIPLQGKKIVFSNALTDDEAIILNAKYRFVTNPIFGIGTFLSNDVLTNEQKNKGIKPLNMVIKLTGADFGEGYCSVVKLSDDLGKHTGDAELIQSIKQQLKIAA